MKILLTSFDPFGNEKINSSLETMKLIADNIDGSKISKIVVPTVFTKSISVVTEAIEAIRPDAVICLGQGNGRSEISIERVAINIDDARIKDNEGNQPIDRRIYEDGPNAYFSSLPIKVMLNAILSVGIPASISNTAGTFVCNHLMYGVLHTLDKKYPHIIGGFIHVPPLKGQAEPCMNARQIADGIEAAIRAIN